MIIEKPNLSKAKSIINKGGYWNSGMFLLRKDSLINNFIKYQNKIYKNSLSAVSFTGPNCLVLTIGSFL